MNEQNRPKKIARIVQRISMIALIVLIRYNGGDYILIIMLLLMAFGVSSYAEGLYERRNQRNEE